jgi:geranylgeranyl reductase family protein
LACAGVSTAVFDKAHLPRYKTCGGGILFRAAKLLQDFNWRHAIERQACQVQLNLLDGHKSFIVSRSLPLVSMTMRDTFDHALVQDAANAGAMVYDKCAALQITEHGSHVDVQTERGAVRAQFIIGADGVRSMVAKAGGWPALRRVIPALEWEVRVSPEDFARFSVMPRFDFDLPAHGYAWVFPKRDHLSIGVLTTRPDRGNLNSDCTAYLERLGIKNTVDIQRHGYAIPLRPRPTGCARGRLLLTGDAAGLADPVTAEGITHAIASGQMAASAIVAGKSSPPAVRRIYNETLERQILSELRHARVLASLLYRRPGVRAWLMGRYGHGLTEMMADIIMGEKSYAEILWNPGNYLKLLRRH